MPPPDWSTLDAAFDRALDLGGADRETYLNSLSDDTREALHPLLRDALAHDPLFDHPDAFLTPLVEEAEASGARGLEERVRVGPYVLQALVGEGGMGRVYRAHRVDGAFEQTVAVKVVRTSLSLAGADVAARLRRERDVLAALDHPGIARLIDGGETEDGVPYLVTEFIDGAPITTWADARGLGTAERVRLIVGVARAVDHAHRRFVVHRDLKPSNVLVTERDGAARPVVLDFGIAKLLAEAEDPASGAFPLTRTGMRMLTPAYAAPELYDPTATITTLADVYGLGALLYEVLTGARPYEDAASGDTARRTASGARGGAVARREPTRPSQVVSHAGSPEAPRQRSQALAGDLDTICLKALHEDPARRYGSASELADDLERHLDGRPIEARRDSRAYVAGRFARRNRGLVGAAVVAVVSLLVGLGATVAALSEARSETARAEEAAGLLGGLLTLGSVAETDGPMATARDLLDSALVRTERVESGPLQAYLFSVLAGVFDSNEDPVRADSLLREMLASMDGIDVEPALRAEVTYRAAVARANVGETGEGIALMERAEREAKRGSGMHVRTLNGRSWLLRSTQDAEGALAVARQALRLAKALPASEAHDAEVGAYQQIGQSLVALHRRDEARAAYERVWALQRERYGATSLQSAQAASSLSSFYVLAGETEKAGDVSRLVYQTYRRVLGPEHHQTTSALAGLGEQLVREGDLEGAERAYGAASVAMEAAFGGNRWFTKRAYVVLADVRNDLGRFEEAETAARHAIELYDAEGMMSATSYDAGYAHVAVGRALFGMGRLREARGELLRGSKMLTIVDGTTLHGTNVPVEHEPTVREANRKALALIARTERGA